MLNPIKRLFSNQVIPKLTNPSKKAKHIFEEAWITKLNSRTIFSVRGRDSTQILQNTVTNDMRLFDQNPERAALYTAFLTVKGKVMFDAIIAKPRLAN